MVVFFGPQHFAARPDQRSGQGYPALGLCVSRSYDRGPRMEKKQVWKGRRNHHPHRFKTTYVYTALSLYSKIA